MMISPIKIVVEIPIYSFRNNIYKIIPNNVENKIQSTCLGFLILFGVISAIVFSISGIFFE
jgi:hypothetical protein